MPPKSTKKAKESTPEPKAKPKTEAVVTPKKDTPTKTTPKKTKEPVVYQKLQKEGAIPVDVSLEGLSIQAKLRKDGGYSHVLKLEAPASFTLLKTVVFTEGPYEGQQAIIIRPAKAFPILKIPQDLRARIYGYYFAQKGVVGQTIVLDGKRANKDIYAKTYAEGSKNRVALLAVNKEIHDEAVQVFYDHPLKVESTSTLLDFLSAIPTSVRPRLHSLEIKTYIKTTSRNAMHFLSEAHNLSRLRIEQGVYGEGDPAKAAKTFYADAYKFLEAIGNAKGRKDAGVDVLEFGRLAFTFKDEKKNAKPWKEDQVADFKESLRAKLK